jgi:hypothetical protein
MLVFGLDGGGIRNFSRALESVDKEEPEAADVGLPECVEKVRVMFVTEEKKLFLCLKPNVQNPYWWV